jgi:hypothetical protein
MKSEYLPPAPKILVGEFKPGETIRMHLRKDGLTFSAIAANEALEKSGLANPIA